MYITPAGYLTVHGRRYLGVLPDPDGPDLGSSLDALVDVTPRGRTSLLLAIAPPWRGWRGWRVFGRIDLHEPLPAEQDARLAFDPVCGAVPGFRADGLVHRLREPAYRGSRDGRSARTGIAAR